MELADLKELASQIGFDHIGQVNMEALVPSEEVRKMCASGRCTMYGHSWSCPPAVPDAAAMHTRMQGFDSGLLLQTTRQMEDDFDLEAMKEAEKVHKKRFETIVRQAKLLDPDCFPMAAGTCTRCRRCTYPDRPCRFEDRVYPSMEACGLLVGEVCVRSGLKYNYGPKTMTYTSCILIRQTQRRSL